MIGIVVPAHNEEETISDCIQAIMEASICARLEGETVELVIVTDACTDATERIALGHGAATVAIQARNVGIARAAGAEFMLARGARWLSFTDADTRVSPGWLADQLALKADAVCGTVGVDDWTPHGEHAALLQWHFSQTYFDIEAHSHVHGANLGVSADAYCRAGGFPRLASGEDVAFVEALKASGAHVAWSARPRVTTSARRAARAPGGFASALVDAVAQRLAEATCVPVPST